MSKLIMQDSLFIPFWVLFVNHWVLFWQTGVKGCLEMHLRPSEFPPDAMPLSHSDPCLAADIYIS